MYVRLCINKEYSLPFRDHDLKVMKTSRTRTPEIRMSSYRIQDEIARQCLPASRSEYIFSGVSTDAWAPIMSTIYVGRWSISPWRYFEWLSMEASVICVFWEVNLERAGLIAPHHYTFSVLLGFSGKVRTCRNWIPIQRENYLYVPISCTLGLACRHSNPRWSKDSQCKVQEIYSNMCPAIYDMPIFLDESICFGQQIYFLN